MLLVFIFLAKAKALLDSLGQKWHPPPLITIVQHWEQRHLHLHKQHTPKSPKQTCTVGTVRRNWEKASKQGQDVILCFANPKRRVLLWVALAKAPKPLLETRSVELVTRRKAGGQRPGGLSFVTGHTHQCHFPPPDDVEHLLKLVLSSWLTSGKDHQLPSQCVRQELSGLCVSHPIAWIPKCLSEGKCKGSKKCGCQRGNLDLYTIWKGQKKVSMD